MKRNTLITIALLFSLGQAQAWSLGNFFSSTTKPQIVEVKVTVPAQAIDIKDSLIAAKDWMNNNRLSAGLAAGSIALTAANIFYLKHKLNSKQQKSTEPSKFRQVALQCAKYTGIAAASVGSLFLLSYFLRDYPTFGPSTSFGSMHPMFENFDGSKASRHSYLEYFRQQPYTDLQKTSIVFSTWIRDFILSPGTMMGAGTVLSAMVQMSMMDELNGDKDKNNFSTYKPDTKKEVRGFASVAGGVPEGINNLKDQIENAKKYNKMGIPLPKGFLFYGPPGTGKTLLGRALAEELNMIFISVKATELESKWLGGSAARVKKLYNLARSYVFDGKKVIIFIDEIDSIAPNRALFHGSHGSQCLTQLLSEIDGLNQTRNIITIGTTNIPENIDPALLRSGRLEQHIEIPLPDTPKRKAILEHYLAQRPHTITADVIEAVAQRIDGASGADVEELIKRAAVFAVRNNKEAIETAELYDAIHKKWPQIQMNRAATETEQQPSEIITTQTQKEILLQPKDLT